MEPMSSMLMPERLAEAAFIALLLAAAGFDLWRFRIPNTIAVFLALGFPIAALVIGVPADWPYHMLGAALVLLVGVVLFMRELIGGGDVKLFAAAALWYGLDRLPAFVLAVSIVGGLLALVVLLAGLGRRVFATAGSHGNSRRRIRGTSLPYGVAIALGGCLVRPLVGI